MHRYCIDCNKKITYYSTRCNSCSSKYRFKNKEEHPAYKKDAKYRLDYFCLECNRKISYRARYCQSCWQKGERNHWYIDGRSRKKYDRQVFNEKLKEKIRRRDNFICQNCGMTEEEHLIVYGKVLSIHHIDYNKQNNNYINLISACLSCNTRFNFNRNYWKNYLSNLVIKDSLLNDDK